MSSSGSATWTRPGCRNICDGLSGRPGRCPDRATGAGCEVELWPAAHRFRAGHRLRVQVSGGAHPRYPRNPGTGEPRGSAVELRAGQREIMHGPTYPSVLRLPVTGPGPA